MADHYYSFSDSASQGAVVGAVSKGTSTASTKIELRVTDGAGITKLQLLSALEAIENYIVADGKPA